MDKKLIKHIRENRLPILWLVSATLFLYFANGLYTVFIAAWLAPVFLIRYLRSQSAGKGLIIAVLVNIVVTIITWRGMIPVPGIYYVIIAGLIGLFSFIPYAIDRFFWSKLNGFLSSLIFPCSWITSEYLNSLFNPYATWGSLIYTQMEGSLAFLQSIAITGIWGPVFLLTWFASVINWIWESDFNWSIIKRGTLVYSGILIVVLFFGGMRLSVLPPQSATVRIASIVSPFEWELKTKTTDAEELEDLRKTTLSVQGELLHLTKQAILGDADVVFWNEAAAPVFEADEKSFIQRGSKLAAKLGVYLMMSLYTRPDSYPVKPLQNKVLMFNPEGKKEFEYMKARPVPGENIERGDSKLAFVDTYFGRIGTAICYDMDFPNLIRQAGKNDVDIMLVPADDWQEINPVHTYMASVRAVENGFSLVRSTKEGLSAAFNYQGRMLNALDDFNTDKKIMFSDVPAKGALTLYSRIGDFFAWLSILGLIILIGLIWKKKAKN